MMLADGEADLLIGPWAFKSGTSPSRDGSRVEAIRRTGEDCPSRSGCAGVDNLRQRP